MYGEPKPGDVVHLKDQKDRFLGSAIYNPNSQIIARRFSRQKQMLTPDFFLRRITQASKLRERSMGKQDLVRLVWSESDGLPGLIVDRYGETLVVQTLTLAMRLHLDEIIDVLADIAKPTCIYVRNDAPVLAVEGIEQECYTAVGKLPEPFVAQSESGVRTNAELNGVKLNAFAENVFDMLSRESEERRHGGDVKWDHIILDPPSFTRNRKGLNGALRGYKEIHLRAMQLLPVGGVVSTFCCSHHISRELFLQVIADAAVDAHCTLRLLAEYDQRADHPVLLNIPETRYLRGFSFELVPGR